MKKLRVFEAFSGIGAQSEALKRLGVSFDVVGWSDIDKRAISIYEHLNPNHVENSGDITKLEHLPECDLLTYSSPCTDFSISGLRMGGDKGSGTHSSLIWEIHRLLGDCKKRGCLPKYLLLENVAGLVMGGFKLFFDRWVEILKEEFGYSTYSAILNADEFNIPQSRNRVFALSVLDSKKIFHFPVGEVTDVSLFDVKDDNCEKYFLTAKQINGILNSKFDFAKSFIKTWEERSACLTAHCAVQPYCVVELVNFTKANSQGARIRSLKGVSFTLTAQSGGFANTGLYLDKEERTDSVRTGSIITHNGKGAIALDGNLYRVRKLSPRETYRLMGWQDDKIDSILSLGMRDGAHYFVCGNSIVVNVLMAIFGEMLNQYEGLNIDWFSKIFGYKKVRKRLF